MSFANPLYLYTLLGLAIPIAIHLWSKKEGKVIKVGSIKNLKESDSKQSSSIKLNEILLLFLRLIFLALITLILAGPYFKQNVKNIAIQYIVEPSLFLDNNYASILDSLKSESTLLLAEKLPPYNIEFLESASKTPPHYWQLASQIEALKADSIVVMSYGYSNGIKGMRPKLNAHINWLTLEHKNTFQRLLSATTKGKNIQLTTLKSTSKHVSFSKETYNTSNSDVIQLNTTKDSVLITLEGKQFVHSLSEETPFRVLFLNTQKSTSNATYIKAALEAISEHLDRSIDIVHSNEDNNISKYDAIISLSDTTYINTKKPLLIYKPDPFAQHLIERGAEKHIFHLTKSLTTEISIKDHLTEQLLSFLNLYENLDIASYNKTTLDQEEIQPKIEHDTTEIIQEKLTVDMSPWLWLLAICMIIAERGLAFYRKQ